MIEYYSIRHSLDVGAIGQVQKSPRASSRRSVLTSHEEGDHHVRNVRVRKRGSVTVGRAHQSGNHIVIVLRQ
jgi:hypothetical protein